MLCMSSAETTNWVWQVYLRACVDNSVQNNMIHGNVKMISDYWWCYVPGFQVQFVFEIHLDTRHDLTKLC